MNPAQVIQYALVAAGVGHLPAIGVTWPVYNSQLNDKPDGALCVYNTSGILDGRLMAGTVIEHQGIQIRVRAAIDADALVKIKAVAAALDSFKNTEVVIGASTYTIQNASRKSPIIGLGVEDGTKRVSYTINYTLTLRG